MSTDRRKTKDNNAENVPRLEIKYTYKMGYSIEPRGWIHFKSCRFSSFAKNMDKTLSSKDGQKLLENTRKSATDAFKRAIQKTAEANGNLIGNKVSDKITGIASKGSREAPSKSTTSAQINGNISANGDTKNKIYITRKTATNYWQTQIIIIIMINITIYSKNGVSENHTFAQRD